MAYYFRESVFLWLSLNILTFCTNVSDSKPVQQQSTAGVGRWNPEELQYAVIPFVIGMNAVDVITHLVETSNEVTRIWNHAISDLNSILRRHSKSYNFQVHEVIDKAVAEAQNIISPTLKSVSTILNLLSNANSIAGLSTVMAIVNEQIERLLSEVQEVKLLLDELFYQTGIQICNAAEEIGIQVKDEIWALVNTTVEQLRVAIYPMMRALDEIVSNAQTTVAFESVNWIGNIMKKLE